MDREEILAKSRNENQKMDERERDVIGQAGKIAAMVGAIVCMLIYGIDYTFAEKYSPSCFIIYGSIMVVANLVKYIKLKRKNELALTIVFGLITIANLVIYIMSFVR